MNSATPTDQLFVNQLKKIEQLIDQHLLEEAAKQLNILGRKAPNDPRLFLLASVMAQSSNNNQGMLSAAQMAVDLAPGWSVASIRLAEAYDMTGQSTLAFQFAERAVTEAIHASVLDTELLTKSAVIAVHSHQFERAVSWANQASAMETQNQDLKHRLAQALAYNHQFMEAVEVCSDILSVDPSNQNVLLDRAWALLHLVNYQQAQLDVTQLLQFDPDNKTYNYLNDLLQGRTPQTQPAQVVSSLFNTYAANFDQHLVGSLQYSLPKDVAKKLIDWYPDRKIDVLDLGCGTGLLGAHLGRIDGALVGVDLSVEMIAKAQELDVYAQFNLVNVLDALKATRDQYYDVITALDVLIYVGDLEPVIPNAYRILTEGGRFIFSCESASAGIEKYSIDINTQRFVHNKNYVVNLLNSAGFKNFQIEEKTLRMQQNEPVTGFIVYATK